MRRPQHVIGLAAGLSLACTLGGAATASAATTSPPGAATTAGSPVIVVLNNQSGSPAATESPVISQVKAAGGTNVIGYSAVASFAATVTPAEAQSLAANPAVASVVPDQKISVTPVSANQVAAAPSGPRMGPGTGPSAICGTPSKPLLPEDLTTTHANEAHAQGITGAGVTVAWIADGLDPGNPDFIRNGKSIFKDYVDFSGNGPGTQTGGEEAFGDASMIAAQGNETYDLSTYNNPAYPLPKNCDIKIEGMAPGASLIGLKAGGKFMANSAILQSIDYAITHGTNVINESFGSNVYSDDNARDAIRLFNDAAVRHGITVTVSTGDAGISGTQASPSTDPNVISAGASTGFQSYEQTGYAGARSFSNGKWVSDNVSALSSGGISQGGQVPDLVAPGEADWALCSTDTAIFTECLNYNGKPTPILLFGGTSEASPVTAGAAALVIQAYREYHHGASPSPALVKQFLTGTATDLGLPAPEQGSGLLNADAAVQAAENYQGGNGSNQPDQLVTTPNQTLLTGAPGAHVSTGVAVTNSGGRAEKVWLGTRNYAQTSGYQANVALNAAADPTFRYPTNGLPWAYKKVDLPRQQRRGPAGRVYRLEGRSRGRTRRLGGPAHADRAGRRVRDRHPAPGRHRLGQLRLRGRRPSRGRHLDGGAVHADRGSGSERSAAALHRQRHPQRLHPEDRTGRLGQPVGAHPRPGPDRVRPAEHQHQRRSGRHGRVGHAGHLRRPARVDPSGAAPRHPHRRRQGHLHRDDQRRQRPSGHPDADEHLLVQRAAG